jgi:hypothetical protein
MYDPYTEACVLEQLDRCVEELAKLESRYSDGHVSKAEYLSCRRSLEQAIEELEQIRTQRAFTHTQSSNSRDVS